MVIDDVKIVLNISDASKDNLLNIYIRKAKTAIINYMNDPKLTPDTVETIYPDAVLELTLYYYRCRGKEHIKEIQEGSHTEIYADRVAALPEFIQTLLPVPYVKMMG